MDTDRIEREILIDAPPERVWAELIEFFWVNARGGALTVVPGARLVTRDEHDHEYPIVIERADPHSVLSYRWASAYPGREPGAGNSTLVEFTLTEEAGRTRLQVIESGFATLPEQDGRQAFQDNTGGWDWVLDRLTTATTAA
ncbi:uncharacterized protein YndB with AHSA1/START domain [Prauserella sediminis]|uniref:Uncharacterized protein YndB with AHSA1/START domain n=1 Tax=Prauserella sediminis TaxID=577680 RepID=A0A839XEY9_9PSEU|nr:SRPBCC domain-containing protein [Prauserella sediminis]MBB3662522.1 uncharacterized protein YndB with AHSA1/START domain [Prauserella sediminis]